MILYSAYSAAGEAHDIRLNKLDLIISLHEKSNFLSCIYKRYRKCSKKFPQYIENVKEMYSNKFPRIENVKPAGKLASYIASAYFLLYKLIAIRIANVV